MSPDPSGEPYGCEVLDTCLTKLKDYYHTSTILRYCRQWQLWDIMARIYAITCQYPQVLSVACDCNVTLDVTGYGMYAKTFKR